MSDSENEKKTDLAHRQVSSLIILFLFPLPKSTLVGQEPHFLPFYIHHLHSNNEIKNHQEND